MHGFSSCTKHRKSSQNVVADEPSKTHEDEAGLKDRNPSSN